MVPGKGFPMVLLRMTVVWCIFIMRPVMPEQNNDFEEVPQ